MGLSAIPFAIRFYQYHANRQSRTSCRDNDVHYGFPVLSWKTGHPGRMSPWPFFGKLSAQPDAFVAEILTRSQAWIRIDSNSVRSGMDRLPRGVEHDSNTRHLSRVTNIVTYKSVIFARLVGRRPPENRRMPCMLRNP